MKAAQAKALYDGCKKRGYGEVNGVLYPPGHPALAGLVKAERRSRSKHIKTGWIDDTRNIANKEKQRDPFMAMVKQMLGLEVWPEFYFTTERQYRFDYAIPITPNSGSLKIAIEVEGGIWAKGNSGHSSGSGIKRDMDKSTLANINGWTLIRCTPDDIKKEPGRVIGLVQKAIDKLNSEPEH